MTRSHDQAKTYRDIELQAKINDASPHKLIEILFDELLFKLQYALQFAEEGEHEKQDDNIQKAIDIVMELHGSISTQVESDLPYNLSRLYEYIQRQLLRARIRNTVPILDEMISLVEPVASGWREIGGE